MKKLSFVLSVVLMSLLVSCSTDSVNSTDKNAADSSNAVVTYNYSQDETELANLINDYRSSIGLNKLELVNYASIKSEEHDIYMIQNNTVSHAGFSQRADDIERILGAKNVAENIAYNYPLGQSALAAWLNSPGHKANIEGDFTHFGISIRVNPENGKKYYTNIFYKK